MLKLHEDIELTCGDGWQIDGTLLDADDKPVNLDPSIQISWTLLDANGLRVADLLDHAELERVDPVSSGKVSITIEAELTTTLRPGRYTDALRISIGGIPSTLWRGMILANADPFARP